MPPKKKMETKNSGKGKGADETPHRIGVVSEERCKPKKCKQECRTYCPVNKIGKLCVGVTSATKIAFISEELCIGRGICLKKCPFDAIQIINLPANLDGETTHRYGANSFKLHRLPTPRPGQVRRRLAFCVALVEANSVLSRLYAIFLA
jgi:ATP-binding cassette, sub-family E, member 1